MRFGKALNKFKLILSGLIPVLFVICSLQSVSAASSDMLDKRTIRLRDTISAKFDVPPMPVGGMQTFYQFIGQHYRISDAAKKAGKSGRVLIRFVVERDGKLTDIEAVEDLGNGTGKEGVRVLRKSPKWNPGMIDGKPVRVMYTVPISINLSPAKKKTP